MPTEKPHRSLFTETIFRRITKLHAGQPLTHGDRVAEATREEDRVFRHLLAAFPPDAPSDPETAEAIVLLLLGVLTPEGKKRIEEELQQPLVEPYGGSGYLWASVDWDGFRHQEPQTVRGSAPEIARLPSAGFVGKL